MREGEGMAQINNSTDQQAQSPAACTKLRSRGGPEMPPMKAHIVKGHLTQRSAFRRSTDFLSTPLRNHICEGEAFRQADSSG